MSKWVDPGVTAAEDRLADQVVISLQTEPDRWNRLSEYVWLRDDGFDVTYSDGFIFVHQNGIRDASKPWSIENGIFMNVIGTSLNRKASERVLAAIEGNPKFLKDDKIFDTYNLLTKIASRRNNA